MSSEEFQFLAASAKQKRISAFQPHDASSSLRLLHQHLIDLLLRHRVVSRTFSHVDRLCTGRDHRQHAVAHQTVIDHHLCLFQHLRSFQSQQPCVPGTGSHQPDFSRLFCFLLFFLSRHSTRISFLNCPASFFPICSASETFPRSTAVS